MTKLDTIERYGQKKEPYVCASCGNCTLICPVFNQIKWESYGPRGKLHMLKSIMEGDADFNQDYADKLFRCNLCQHCTTVCTTSINLDHFWEVARAEARSIGLIPPPVQFVYESVKTRGDIMWMGSSDRLLWTESIEDVVRDRINKPAEVAFFTGCNVSLKTQLHDVALSLVKILEHAKVDYTILGDQEVCCGAPLIWAGDFEGVSTLAEQNMEKMKELGVKTIIFSCPSCIQTWKSEYSKFRMESDDTEFELMTSSQFIRKLNAEGKLSYIEQPMVTVTYHDPCISARDLKITEEPRDVIEQIPGVYKVEMAPSRQETRCCGSHALLDVVDPLLASQIAETRLRDATVTPASRIVTECPRCLLAFDLASFTMGYKVKIQDITELVAECLDTGEMDQ
ncbi:MAG: (Fe-S)-binding protein [Candidatus Thorarchaeota archaeon]